MTIDGICYKASKESRISAHAGKCVECTVFNCTHHPDHEKVLAWKKEKELKNILGVK